MIDESSRFSALETLLARLMLGGVLVSAVCLLIGLVLWLGAGDGDAMLRTGLIVLMGTPMLRVVVALLEAHREEDWFLVGATCAVLLLFAATLLKSYRLASGG